MFSRASKPNYLRKLATGVIYYAGGEASRLRSTFKGKAQTVEDEIRFSRDAMEESEEGN